MIIRKARLKDIPEIVLMFKEFMREHDRMVVRSNRELAPHLRKKPDSSDRYLR